ncbi:hypothetical protein D3C81_521430 [compost metagenome]
MATSTFGRNGMGMYTKDSSIYSIFHGSNAMVLEDELNETQWNIIENIASSLRNQYSSGLLSNYTVKESTTNNSFYIESSEALKLLINGYFLKIGHNSVTTPMEISPAENILLIQLNAAGTSARTDLVVLETWFEIVKYSDSLRKFGGATTPILTNNMLDNRVGKETSRRLQLKWRIRSVNSKSSMSGITAFNYKNVDSGVQYAETNGVYYASTGVQYNTSNEFVTGGEIYAIPLFTVARPANNNKIAIANVLDITPKAMFTVVSDPTEPNQIATKQYVDSVVQGLDVKETVKVATTANITLSGIQTIDGVTLVAGNRVLVKNQTTGSQNGIYIVSSGAWTRSTDMSNNSQINSGMFTFVEEGTANGHAGFVLTTSSPIDLGTTALTFVQFSGAGQIVTGTGITKSGNTLSLTSGIASPGTYKSVTVDTYGRVTSGTNPTTLLGYGITDGVNVSDVVTTATANKILKLDLNGLLPTGVTGNSGTATKLQIARTFTFSQDATGSVSFDGSGNVTIPLTLSNSGVPAGTYKSVTVDSKGRVTSGTNPTTLSEYEISDAVSIDDVVTTATANKILKLNASGLLPASVTGNAATATKLATSRTFTFSQDVTGAVSFDGSVNITIPITLANSGVTAGTYKSVTVDAKGRITGGTNPTTLSGYGITDALPISGGTLTGNITAPSAYASNWFRSTGATGWYSQDFGGGIHMEDTTWVKVYNNKSFLVNAFIQATSGIVV